MADFKITKIGYNPVTCVPDEFIKTYMPMANGDYVKVYLYLLYCVKNDQMLSVSSLADYFQCTENDIKRALKYWEKVGVIGLELNEKNQLTGLCFKDLTGGVQLSKISDTKEIAVAEPTVSDAPVVEPVDTTAPKSTKTKKSPANKKREYTLDEIKEFHNNHEVSELVFIIETYLRHPLNSTEMNTVFFWYDGLKFSGELIEYLVEYCITNGHASLRYMDKVALGWAENEIDSIDKAKEHVAIRSKAYYSIMKAFGISGRNLADSEIIYVNKIIEPTTKSMNCYKYQAFNYPFPLCS